MTGGQEERVSCCSSLPISVHEDPLPERDITPVQRNPLRAVPEVLSFLGLKAPRPAMPLSRGILYDVRLPHVSPLYVRHTLGLISTTTYLVSEDRSTRLDWGTTHRSTVADRSAMQDGLLSDAGRCASTVVLPNFPRLQPELRFCQSCLGTFPGITVIGISCAT